MQAVFLWYTIGGESTAFAVPSPFGEAGTRRRRGRDTGRRVLARSAKEPAAAAGGRPDRQTDRIRPPSQRTRLPVT